MSFTPTPLNIIAKIISGVVHPMLMPFFGILVLINLPSALSHEQEQLIRTNLLIVVGVCTMVMPTIAIMILKFSGAIQSIHLNDQNDRRLPFIITGICYTACYILILRMRIPMGFFPYNLAYPLMLGGTISVVTALVVNHWFKISIHMMAVGGVTGSIITVALLTGISLTPLIIVLIALSGIVGFARLQLNAHTPAQVYSGFLTGALSNAAILLYIFHW